MYRIHLTAQDIARVRVIPSLGPMAETLFSLEALRDRTRNVVFGQWRRRVHAAMGDGLRGLAAVVPAARPCLDLTTIAAPRQDEDGAVEAILSAGRDAVLAELDSYAGRHRAIPADLRDLADTQPARRVLMRRLSDYHRSAVAPAWTIIRGHLDADRAARARALVDGGVERLLACLHSEVVWDATVLHIPSAMDGDIHLDGRGLVLAPSFFLRRPATLFDPRAPGDCILVCPIPFDGDDAGEVWTVNAADAGLARLIGRTRAVLLTTIADGAAGTGELAGRVGTSAAAVSQHTKVLREAGLILTRRDGPAVRHTITERGRVLLDRPHG